MFALRIASVTANAPRRGAGTSENAPLNRPIGVRAAPATTTWVLDITVREQRTTDKSMSAKATDLWGESFRVRRRDGFPVQVRRAVKVSCGRGPPRPPRPVARVGRSDPRHR